MSVNAVKNAPAQNSMSKTEHIVRSASPFSTGVYDIGKALINGKSFGEAYDISNKNIQTVYERNGKALKNAHEKTVDDFKEAPFKTWLTGSYVGHFFKHLFE